MGTIALAALATQVRGWDLDIRFGHLPADLLRFPKAHLKLLSEQRSSRRARLARIACRAHLLLLIPDVSHSVQRGPLA
ncbi:hypothetical protein [Nocardiopsis synnemataformans]|uniref:hypothetical protein n=1 Tax=Nocardiopsis synnemataformans TaxID=61305 RepID=UPI003EBEDDDA